MKKMLMRLGMVGMLMVAMAGAAFFVIFGDDPPIVDAQDLGGVRLVKDGYVSAFLVDVGNGDFALVDAGNDPKATAILGALEEMALGPAAVKAIFLTHGHPDHIAGVSQFPEARLYALSAEVPLVEGRVSAKGPIPSLFPPNALGLKVSDPVEDGQVVTVGDRTFEAFAVPGHTAGSTCWFAAGVLFMGDNADTNKAGNMVPARSIFTDDMDQNVASLHRLADRLRDRAEEVRYLAFAHTGTLEGAGALGGW